MSDTGHKYKHFVEVTMIPLNGVYPIIYNLEMDLLATAMELRRDIIKLMQKHNERMKYVLNFYFKQIEQSVCKYGDDKSYLFIVPVEIIDLCGSFYDEYYPMSMNIKVENLVVLNKNEHIITDDSKIDLSPRYSDITQLKVYELLDNEILNRYLKLNNSEIEYKVIRIFHVGQSLVMKLPLNIFVNSNTMIDMVNKKLKPYIKLSNENEAEIELFDIHIGEHLLTELDGLCVIMFRNSQLSESYRIYPIYNNKDREGLMMNISNKRWLIEIFYNHALSSRACIQITWHVNVFKNEIFKNPTDTIVNHVCAIEFDDDDTDAINKIQNMFD